MTSTLPAACAGALTKHSVLETHSTDAAFVVPKLKTVAVLPSAKPAPVMVTVVPPAIDPVLGLRPVIVGRNLK